MKKTELILLVIAILTISMFACRGQKQTQKDNQDKAFYPSGLSVEQSNKLFAFELYKQIGNNPGNVFYSPYSISTALAMTYAGARGSTEKEFQKVLHFAENNEQFHNNYQKLLAYTNSLDTADVLNIYTANSIWTQKDFKFLDDFIAKIKNNYNSAVFPVDFIRETEKSRMEINKWVEQQTKDKIKELIAPGILDVLTRLVLVNAIYFNGKWQVAFDPALTQKRDFYLDAENKVTADFMFSEAEYLFYQDENCKALQIPYSGGKVSMLLVLPNEINGLANLRKTIDTAMYEKIIKGLSTTKVKIYIPKFKTTSEFELSKNLIAMGMPLAFSDDADFSGMTGKKDLRISHVIHKAFVEVNEAGTEAAAATAVVVRIKSMPANQPEFKADHPFMFFIKENKTNNILFAGHINNPNR